MVVVRSKLRPPPLRPDALFRRELVERLVEGAAGNAVLLVGPAGYGKTTALAQLYAARRESAWATAWLTFDEADNEPRQLYEHLSALLVELGEGALPAQPEDARSLSHPAWLAEHLQRLNRPIALFLDDFHLLEAPELVTFFRRLLPSLPEHACLYVGARELPELGLSRLAVRGHACVLDATQLSFSRSEVAALFATSNLSEQELDALHARTSGWPAALQLFRMALASPRVRASLAEPQGLPPRELSVYLSENVLALQAPEVREFLLATAPLETLTVELARHVTHRDDAHLLLARLERAGFFVRAHEADATSFRYHPVLAQMLIAQLEARSPDEVRSIHHRAADHYATRGESAGVVRHAVACGDFERAADALDVWSSELVASGRLATAERWFDQIPSAYLATRTSLCIKAAYAKVFLRRLQRLESLPRLLAQCPKGALAETRDPSVVLTLLDVCVRDEFPDEPALGEQPPPAACGGFAAFELAAKHNLSAFRAMLLGDYTRGQEQIALARAYGEYAGASFSSAYTDSLASASRILAGDLRGALVEQRSALARSLSEDEDAVASAVLIASHVWALYEADELSEAASLFERHRHAIARATVPDLLIMSYASAARAHEALGEAARARALRDEVRAIARAQGWPRPRAAIDWDEVRSLLRAGDVARAQALASRLEPPGRPLPPYVVWAEHVICPGFVLAELSIARGELQRVEGLLSAELERASVGAYRELQCAMLRAELGAARGTKGVARQSLRKGLRLAADGGFARIVREASDRLAPKLGEFAMEEGGSLAAATLEAPPSDAPTAPNEVGLSERELEVMHWLADGASNRDIARAMFVSENTVKFHLKSVYAKLQVDGRVQAVRAAQRLGVIRS